MQRLSAAEKAFIDHGVESNVRSDGRDRLSYRHFAIETGIVSQANGSVRLRLGGVTDVVVGVKAELSRPEATTPNTGTIHFSVECCPSASPEFEGKAGEELNHELARMMAQLMKGGLDLKSLCLLPGKICWVLYVDVMVMDSGGNLFDAICIATRAALYNTRIPKVQLTGPDKTDVEVEDDLQLAQRLKTENLPVCITLFKIGSIFVVDATLEEELCMKSRVTVAVNRSGNVCGTQKGGVGGLEPSLLFEMMNTAQSLGKELIDKCDALLREEEKLARAPIGFFAAPL